MKTAYIKKEVAFKKISVKYKPIVEDVKNRLLNFSDKIDGIYLYGSVATGKAKSPDSDLDILIVLKKRPTSIFKNQLKKLEKYFSDKYQKIFREVGFATTYREEVFKSEDAFGWRFFITVLSLKIFGNTLFEKEMKFKSTKKLAKNLHLDFNKNIKESRGDIINMDKKGASLQVKSIMKKIIRVAFSLVMEKENYWTTDLDEMKEIFIKYYPEKEQEINSVLKMVKHKKLNREAALSIIDNFGNWVLKEYLKL